MILQSVRPYHRTLMKMSLDVYIVETAAVRLNIRLARGKFETLQADSLN